MMKIRLNKHNVLNILFWGILYLIFLFQMLPQTSLIEAFVFPFVLLGTSYPFTTYLGMRLLPNAIKNKQMGKFVLQFIIYSFIFGAIFLSYLLIFTQLEKNGYFPPSYYFDIQGYPFYFFTVFFSGGLLINLCFCGLGFYYQHNELEKEHLKSQLQTLKGQINPHFMFNVLNHINYYVEKKDDLASPLLLKYADILRYQLYSGKEDTVTLEEEIQFLKNFIDIENIRWEGRLNVNCSWTASNTSVRVPPLLFIPLIENAFKHVHKPYDAKGYIDIDFKQENKRLYLQVRNSKRDKPASIKESSGLGLSNLRNRLNILYNHTYDLSVNESDSIYDICLSIHI